MGPKPSQPQSGELFRPRLDEQIVDFHAIRTHRGGGGLHGNQHLLDGDLKS